MAFMDKKAILTKAFRDMDVDHSGYLDGFEIEEVFIKYYKSLGRRVDYEDMMNQVLDFMKKVDTNGDKKVTLDEFLDYFMNQRDKMKKSNSMDPEDGSRR